MLEEVINRVDCVPQLPKNLARYQNTRRPLEVLAPHGVEMTPELWRGLWKGKLSVLARKAKLPAAVNDSSIKS